MVRCGRGRGSEGGKGYGGGALLIAHARIIPLAPPPGVFLVRHLGRCTTRRRSQYRTWTARAPAATRIARWTARLDLQEAPSPRAAAATAASAAPATAGPPLPPPGPPPLSPLPPPPLPPGKECSSGSERRLISSGGCRAGWHAVRWLADGPNVRGALTVAAVNTVALTACHGFLTLQVEAD